MRTALWLALILSATPALAGARRLAIVFGHNGGQGERLALRYAEADAARVARVLVEAGRVEPAHLRLLQGRPLAELFAALEWARAQVRADPQTLLLVYLSSHATAADGLLPGSEQLTWKDLKRRVTATGAGARVTIVDACQSAGLIEAAARAAPTFTLEAEDRLTVEGDAFITSSASQEPSLEAGQLRGSVFTQHLVAALRGAGDVSGDGQVSLDEAYRYAYERTATGESGQHPGLAVRLSGYGELVVSQVTDDGPGLIVPPSVERLVVRDPRTRDVLLSAVRPAGARLRVPAGSWLVELEREGKRKEGRLEVPARGYGLVDEEQLTARATSASLVRLQAAAPCPPIEVAVALPLLLELRARLRPALERVCASGRVTSATLSKPQHEVSLSLVLDDEVVRLTRAAAKSGELVQALEALALKSH
ncbi:MAG: caspase family protein [Myxococcus sp.]|nr:caspase family protein [Myxococcus sp.]